MIWYVYMCIHIHIVAYVFTTTYSTLGSMALHWHCCKQLMHAQAYHIIDTCAAHPLLWLLVLT
jgi:hypothetical protein